MIYFPPVRRLLVPAVGLVAFIVIYRSLLSTSPLPPLIDPLVQAGERISARSIKHGIPIMNSTMHHLTPAREHFFDHIERMPSIGNITSFELWQPVLDPNLTPLFECRKEPNKYTGHIRLPNIVRNISCIPPLAEQPDIRTFWNPTFIALPHWAENEYLLVSRVVTDGNYQQNVVCEAYMCLPESEAGTEANSTRTCSEDDIEQLGPTGGLRCAHSPVTLSVAPTPADQCHGKFATYADIAGFHDPRIFWSGKGEPLMVVNTQYACFGLWIIDLRSLYQPLDQLLSVSNQQAPLGPLKSYRTLTELTRNPPSTRSTIEKNWFLFFSTNGEAFIHYDLSAEAAGRYGRSFAKLLGNGFTTTNLTDPLEDACIVSLEPEDGKPRGHWHQATNSLRLVLCHRSDPLCTPRAENTVFFALIHRKFPNALKLPLRYERIFIVWSATPPFGMLAISEHPILMANETAGGWSAAENWEDDIVTAPSEAPGHSSVKHPLRRRDDAFQNTSQTVQPDEQYEKSHWADFTYTVSMAYAHGRKPRGKPGDGHGDRPEDMHAGYLDDEVVLGIGVDDAGSVFAQVRAEELLQCMRACPGRTQRRKRPSFNGTLVGNV